MAYLAEQITAAMEEREGVKRVWREWCEAALPSQFEKVGKTFRNEAWVDVGCREGWPGALAGFQAKKAVPSGRILQELKSETQNALSELCLLQERIRSTDGLIDDIVYRLHGLTEEEIRIVEGRVIGDGRGS